MTNVNLMVLESINKYERTTPFDKYRSNHPTNIISTLTRFSRFNTPHDRVNASISDDLITRKSYNNDVVHKMAARNKSKTAVLLSNLITQHAGDKMVVDPPSNASNKLKSYLQNKYK